MTNMIDIQNKLMIIAMQRQQSINEHNMNKRTTSAIPTEFPINSFVLVNYPNTRMGKLPPTKLHTPSKGPMRVLNFIGADYQLLNLITNKTEHHNINNIKPFYYDPEITNPYLIALRDNEETKIAKILQHSGDKKNKKDMDFLVQWENQDESNNLWLPWYELRNNSKLHEYLRNNRMKSLIPISYR